MSDSMSGSYSTSSQATDDVFIQVTSIVCYAIVGVMVLPASIALLAVAAHKFSIAWKNCRSKRGDSITAQTSGSQARHLMINMHPYSPTERSESAYSYKGMMTPD